MTPGRATPALVLGLFIKNSYRVDGQGGTFVFLEHVLAEDKPLLALQQVG